MAPLRVTGDELFAHQPGQCAVHRRRRGRQLLGQRIDGQWLTGPEPPGEDQLAHPAVHLGVLPELELPELAPEVGERRALRRIGVDGLGEEHPVRSLPTTSATRHSTMASTPGSTGTPVRPGDVEPGELVVGPRPREPFPMRPWCSARMFTAKRPERCTASWVALAALRQTSSIGGSSESEETALTVMPRRAPSCSVVITTTPVMKLPITRRNTAPSKAGPGGASTADILVLLVVTDVRADTGAPAPAARTGTGAPASR